MSETRDPERDRPVPAGQRQRGRIQSGEGSAYPMASLVRGRVGFLAVSEGGRSTTIMVGPVRGPEHLEVIRTHRFYHVPASAIAASRLAVPYIAFYEGAARFKRATGLIQQYARVLKVTRARRGDLPGLTWPGRQGEEAPYYRFDLAPLQTLPRPITNPDQLRVVFRFPDMQQLRQAETLRDLGGRRGGNRTVDAGAGRPTAARGRKGTGRP